MYEGGIRVPLIARWTGHVAAGSTSDLPIAFYDFLPTAADMAHLPAPAATDGISFLPTLLGEPQSRRHDFLYWEFHERGFEQAVRYDDRADHKIWKAVRHGLDQPLELYDLSADIGETKNVAAAHPDVVKIITTYLRTARTDSAEFPIRAARPNRAAGSSD